jgi:hypothetical protein
VIKNKKNIPYIMERLIDICKSPETGINIWLIINGIRPAYWLDSYAIQSKKKMDELLKELKKYEFIGYKFLEEYEKKQDSNYGPYFPEGPLIFNKKLLNKKDINLIEKSGIELYHTKKFGELLGYGKCAKELKKNGLGDIVIHFNIHKVGDNLAKYEQLFGLKCNIKSVDTKYYFDLFVKMNQLLKGSKYHISLRYMDKKAFTVKHP